MIPILAGDLGTNYTHETAVSDFTMVLGSTKVSIGGRSVMLLGRALTTGGPIVTATLFTQKVLVEGLPVLAAGAVTSLATGWQNGLLIPLSAGNVSVN